MTYVVPNFFIENNYSNRFTYLAQGFVVSNDCFG